VKIDAVEVLHRSVPLTVPYTISRETIAAVELSFVRVHAGRLSGSGCASPAPGVTGETPAACRAALAAAADVLEGAEAHALGTLARRLERELPATPAARAACDMALWDLHGQALGVPVVALLGRAHAALPTSVTIGIQQTESALAAARTYLERGFRALKVKLGRDVAEEVERLRALRALVGPSIAIRVDPNAGYDADALRTYLAGTRDLELELCEQPLPRGGDAVLRSFPEPDRARFAADESVLGMADAARLLEPPRPYGVLNLKLMKCGGITPATRLAHLAEGAGLALMWGCNDESRVAIAAALHVALSSPATRYLDLDGSFDLASDPVAGGFELDAGLLSPAPGPGLGSRWTG
jgi:L-alanine-DL-glutamate epimerase-like enolase superfamily enzyme